MAGGVLADDFLDALVRKDAREARALVERLVEEGTPPQDVVLDVLQPALYEIGRRWAVAELTVADEHYATAITQSLLGALRARIEMPPRDGRLAVVSCTPDEQHALGGQVVADFLEADGWEVLALGAAMPVDDLVQLCDQERPDLLALSTSTAGRMPGVDEVLRAVDALRPRPLIVLGGQLWTAAAEELALRLGADHIVRGPRELVAWARERCPPPQE